MKKGARFRETPFWSKNKYITVLYAHIDKFIEKWSRKEGSCLSNFDKWGKLLKNMIKSRILKIKFTPLTQVLQDDDVKSYLDSLHSKFVICPIDKAGHNFAIVCKKFYIDVLKMNSGSMMLYLAMPFISL